MDISLGTFTSSILYNNSDTLIIAVAPCSYYKNYTIFYCASLLEVLALINYSTGHARYYYYIPQLAELGRVSRGYQTFPSTWCQSRRSLSFCRACLPSFCGCSHYSLHLVTVYRGIKNSNDSEAVTSIWDIGKIYKPSK